MKKYKMLKKRLAKSRGLVPVAEAAARLGISRRCLDYYGREGYVPKASIPVGKRKYYREEDVQAMMEILNGTKGA